MSQAVGGVSTPVIFLGVLAVFWFVLFLLKQAIPEKLEKLGLDVNVPLLLWRTKRFNNLLDAIARRARNSWKIVGTIGFALSLGLIPLAVDVMSQGFWSYIVTQIALYGPEPLKTFFLTFFHSAVNQPTAPVTLFLPGVTVGLESLFDGTLIVALLVVIVVHEGSHGVLARAEGIKVKSSGLLLLLAIPGAFVEPDEEELSKAKKVSQLRIFSAGTSANFVTGMLILLVVLNFGVYYATISPLYQPSAGVLVLSTVPNSPAVTNASISIGEAITNVGNSSVSYPITDEFSFQAALNHLYPHQTISMQLLNTSSGTTRTATATLTENPDNKTKGFLGVTTFNYYPAKFPGFLNSFAAWTLYKLYNNIALFSIGIAAINMLPIWGLDGDRVIKLLLAKLFGKHEKAAAYSLDTLRVLSITMIALAVIVTYVTHGQVQL